MKPIFTDFPVDYLIEKYDDKGRISISMWMGKNRLIKTIQDFNEKCSLLFGFELVE